MQLVFFPEKRGFEDTKWISFDVWDTNYNSEAVYVHYEIHCSLPGRQVSSETIDDDVGVLFRQLYRVYIVVSKFQHTYAAEKQIGPPRCFPMMLSESLISMYLLKNAHDTKVVA